MRPRLELAHDDRCAEAEDEDGEVVETDGDKGDVPDQGLEDEGGARGELGEDGEDRRDETRGWRAVL